MAFWTHLFCAKKSLWLVPCLHTFSHFNPVLSHFSRIIWPKEPYNMSVLQKILPVLPQFYMIFPKKKGKERADMWPACSPSILASETGVGYVGNCLFFLQFSFFVCSFESFHFFSEQVKNASDLGFSKETSIFLENTVFSFYALGWAFTSHFWLEIKGLTLPEMLILKHFSRSK